MKLSRSIPKRQSAENLSQTSFVLNKQIHYITPAEQVDIVYYLYLATNCSITGNSGMFSIYMKVKRMNKASNN